MAGVNGSPIQSSKKRKKPFGDPGIRGDKTGTHLARPRRQKSNPKFQKLTVGIKQGGGIKGSIKTGRLGGKEVAGKCRKFLQRRTSGVAQMGARTRQEESRSTGGQKPRLKGGWRTAGRDTPPGGGLLCVPCVTLEWQPRKALTGIIKER